MNNIEIAFQEVTEKLRDMKYQFLDDLEENPENYKEFSVEDAINWFIEELAS